MSFLPIFPTPLSSSSFFLSPPSGEFRMASVHFEQMGAHSAEDLNKLAWGKRRGGNKSANLFLLSRRGRKEQKKEKRLCLLALFEGGWEREIMLSSQSASNPKILLFLLFCFKCRNSFCLRRFLASSAGYSCRRLQLYGRPPPSDEWVLRTRPPRISIAPHQLVRRREIPPQRI